jgi:hypothetical protein
MAEEMYPVFIARSLSREASAALLLFLQAARMGELTVEAITRLSVNLTHLWPPPGREVPPGRFVV